MNYCTMSTHCDNNINNINEKHLLRDLKITLTRCDEPLWKLNLSSINKQNGIQEFSESSSEKQNFKESLSKVEVKTKSLGEKISLLDNFHYSANPCKTELALDDSSNQSETTVSCSPRAMYDIGYLSDDNTSVVESSQVLSLNSEDVKIFPAQNHSSIFSHEKLQKDTINSMDIKSVGKKNGKAPSTQHMLTDKILSQVTLIKKKVGRPRKESLEPNCQNTCMINNIKKTYEDNTLKEKVDHSRKEKFPTAFAFDEIDGYSGLETLEYNAENEIKASQEISNKKKVGRPRKESGNSFQQQFHNTNTTFKEISLKRKAGRPRKENKNNFEQQCQSTDEAYDINKNSKEISKKKKAGRPRKESGNNFEQLCLNKDVTYDIHKTSQEISKKRKFGHPWKESGNSFEQQCQNTDTTNDLNNPSIETSKKRKAGRPRKEHFLIEIISDNDECSENEINAELKCRVEDKNTKNSARDTLKKKVGRPRKEKKPNCLVNNQMEVTKPDLKIKENRAHGQISKQGLNPEAKKIGARIRLKTNADKISNGRICTRSNTLSNSDTLHEKRLTQPVNTIKLGLSEKTLTKAKLKLTSPSQHKSLFKSRCAKKSRTKRFTRKKNRSTSMRQPPCPYIEIDRDEVNDSFGMIPFPLGPSSIIGNSNISNQITLSTTAVTGHTSSSNIRPPLPTTVGAAQSSFSNLSPHTSTCVSPFPISLIYNKSVSGSACHSAHSCCKKCAVSKTDSSTQWEDPAEIFAVIANLTAQKRIPLNSRRFILKTVANANSSEKCTNLTLPKTTLLNSSASQNVQLLTNTVGQMNSSETCTNPEVPKNNVLSNPASEIVRLLTNTAGQVKSSEISFNPKLPKTSLQNDSVSHNVLLTSQFPINNLLDRKNNTSNSNQSSMITFPLILHKITPISSQSSLPPLFANINPNGASNISQITPGSSLSLCPQQSPNFTRQNLLINTQNPTIIQQDLINKPSFSFQINQPLNSNLSIQQGQKILSNYISKNTTKGETSLKKLKSPLLRKSHVSRATLKNNLQPSLISSKHLSKQQKIIQPSHLSVNQEDQLTQQTSQLHSSLDPNNLPINHQNILQPPQLQDQPTVETTLLHPSLDPDIQREQQQILPLPQLVPVHLEGQPTVESSSVPGKPPALQKQNLQPPQLVPVHLEDISHLCPSLDPSKLLTIQQQILQPPQIVPVNLEDQLNVELFQLHPPLDPSKLSTIQQEILQPPQLKLDQLTVETSLLHPSLDSSLHPTIQQQILQPPLLEPVYLDQPNLEMSLVCPSLEPVIHTTEQQLIVQPPQLPLQDQLTLDTSLWHPSSDSLEPSNHTTEQQLILQPSQLQIDQLTVETSPLHPSLDPSLQTKEPHILPCPQLVPVHLEDQQTNETYQLCPSLNSGQHPTSKQQILQPSQLHLEVQPNVETSQCHPSLDSSEPSEHAAEQQPILQPSMLHLDQLILEASLLHPSSDPSTDSTAQQEILQPDQLHIDHLTVETPLLNSFGDQVNQASSV